jgi:imidazolonepropionase-like amidohydrolase
MLMQERTLVITGVNIIDVSERTVHRNNVIICVDGKITSFGSAESVTIPETAETLTPTYSIATSIRQQSPNRIIP